MTGKLTIEALMAVVGPEGCCISPDGKYVVYSLCSFHCRLKEHQIASIWIAELGKESSAKRMTQGESKDTVPSFSPSGKYIGFLSDRARPGKASALYMMPVSGGEAFALTKTDNEMDIGAYKWHPKNDSIAYISPDEKSEERKKNDKEKNDANVYGQYWQKNKLRTVDVESKKCIDHETGDDHISRFAWSPNGEEIVIGTIPTPEINYDMSVGMRISILNLNSGKLDHLQKRVKGGRQLTWSDQGIVLNALFDHDCSISTQALYSVGKQDGEYVLNKLAYGVSDCAEEVRTCSSRTVVRVQKGMAEELHTLNATEPLYRGKHNLVNWDAYFDGDSCSLVIVKSTTDTPGELYSITNGTLCQLTEHNKEVAKLGIGKSVLCEYEAEDGTPVDGFYSVPTKLQSAFDKKKPLPTVLVVHGGPSARSSDTFGFDDLFITPWLVANDYLVLHPNYRGGTSHGDKYQQAVKNKPDASYQDLIWLVKKGIDEGRIDKDRVIIQGWSYGGYLAFLAATRHSDFPFAGYMSGAGVSDWGMMTSTTDIIKFASDVGGHTPWDGIDNIVNRDRTGEPIYNVKHVKGPVLVIHGEDDTRVPVSQSKCFHRAMLELGKECELVTYPRDGHGFPVPLEKSHYIDFLERSLAFVKKHIGEPTV